MGKIGIIIRREFYERVRKRSFILTTILTPLLMIGFMGALFAVSYYGITGGEVKQIVVCDQSGMIAPHLENSKKVTFQISDKSADQVKAEKMGGEHEHLFGILEIGEDIMENPRNIQLYSYASSNLDLEASLERDIASIIEGEKLKNYEIENLSEILNEVKTSASLRAFRVDESGSVKESTSALATATAYVFGFLIYMFIFIYGGMVMQGVIEEKRSKVLEIMVSSVRPFQLMMGKILGIALVAITQFLIWIVLIIVGVAIMMQFISPEIAQAISGGDMAATVGGMDMSSISPDTLAIISKLTDPTYIITMLLGFLLFFIGGYLLYAAMFAAIGSAVDNEADTQQLQMPLTIPLILAIVVLISVLKEPNSSLAFWFSIIPFTSPIIMMARLPYGMPMWEIMLSLAILYASFIFMVWLAGKIYRVGIFMYGKKPSFKEILKWSRYKY